MPKKYDEEIKKQTVHCCESGQTIKSVCQEYKIAPSTMYRWMKEYHPIVSKHLVYSPVEFYDISRKLAKAEHQLEIIKLTQCMDEIPLTKRLEMLDALHEREKQYSIHEICEALGVARGTFYNHIFRKADRSKALEEDRNLCFRYSGYLTTANSDTARTKSVLFWRTTESIPASTESEGSCKSLD